MGQSSSSGNRLCLKPACLHASSHLLQNLAQDWEKVDPCTDFYQMACGGAAERWEDNTDTIGSLLPGRISRIIRKVIEAPYGEAVEYHSIMTRNDIDEANHGLLQRDYLSCMNTEALLAAGATPLVEVLKGLAEAWPVNPDDTSTLDESEYEDLYNAIIYLEQRGVSSFRELETVALPFLTEPDIVYPSVFPLKATHNNASVYGDPDALEAYAAQVAVAFSGGLYSTNMSESQAQGIAQQVVSFETSLVAALGFTQAEWTAQLGPDAIGLETVKMSLADLESLAPVLGLDKAVSFFAPPDYKKDQVLLSNPAFFTNISAIVEAAPKTAIQSWLAWRTIVSLADDAFDTFTQTTVQGAIASTPPKGKQWEQCIAHTDKSLRWIMDRYFVSATYTSGMKDVVTRMTTNIQGALVKRFSELDWMTDGVKTRAIDKANKMQINVGFPTQTPDLRSPNSLAAYYQGLQITDDYFSNVLAARLNNLKTDYAAVGKPMDRARFYYSAHTVNAYFFGPSNSITILAGISQPPLLHPDLPSYAVYGTGGSIIGHEFTHGFDNNGHKFDQDGAAKGWFDNTTSAAFEERAQCFVKEFNGYEVPLGDGKTINVNGQTTLGENLSDAGGLRVAFEAWKALEGDEKNNQNLPGLENFSHEQLFYLFWANGWCGTETAEATKHQIETDEHSPARFRIIGGAENSRAFKEAWGCKVKEPTCELF